ncbi:Crp/Fnr family transcriptional regulator [Sporosarcina sp. P37]|uniref:Crp/Fnr family transcriptional regulator n=1 Tax=unclassified Sporosarcina TaxID=2647733 RepID=UPI000A17A5FA|nr:MULTISPECIES: Crp/Fnr family transcriptional regulator [unclassified Sporosarcina]ARK25092.1 Crp/Fnr family transcriptional regulator [Sporosarcina sp. P37]PID17917.1 Crp/Fnr family transcriptional regulator [Sporosarcina sp. P35]
MNQHQHDDPMPYYSCVSRVPLFNHLEEQQMDRIVELAHSASHSRGATIYREGDHPQGLYILHKGRIKIYRLSENGKEQLVRILEPGDFTGELSLFDAKPHDAYAETLEPAELCIIGRDQMQKLLQEHPAISLKMLEEFSHRLAGTEQRAARIGMESAETRLALYLADLSEEQQQLTVELPMSRKDLASHIGTTPETISRKLSFFEDSGWIRQSGTKTVHILDLDKLLLV